MSLFSKSLEELLREKADLEAQMQTKARSLLQNGPQSAGKAIGMLSPEAKALMAVNDAILRKSPRGELVARRDELRRALSTKRPTDEHETANFRELWGLEAHLRRRNPLLLALVIVTLGVPALLLWVIFALNYL